MDASSHGVMHSPYDAPAIFLFSSLQFQQTPVCPNQLSPQPDPIIMARKLLKTLCWPRNGLDAKHAAMNPTEKGGMGCI